MGRFGELLAMMAEESPSAKPRAPRTLDPGSRKGSFVVAFGCVCGPEIRPYRHQAGGGPRRGRRCRSRSTLAPTAALVPPRCQVRGCGCEPAGMSPVRLPAHAVRCERGEGGGRRPAYGPRSTGRCASASARVSAWCQPLAGVGCGVPFGGELGSVVGTQVGHRLGVVASEGARSGCGTRGRPARPPPGADGFRGGAGRCCVPGRPPPPGSSAGPGGRLPTPASGRRSTLLRSLRST
jgi:hypothetical protein